MLQFLLKLLLFVLFARLLARLVRLVRHEGRRGSVEGVKPRRKRSAADLGEDIVDAEFEEISRKQEP